jgi:hypothetical protein
VKLAIGVFLGGKRGEKRLEVKRAQVTKLPIGALFEKSGLEIKKSTRGRTAFSKIFRGDLN